MGAKDELSRDDIDAALQKLPDWRYQASGLHTVFKAGSARGALDLIARIGDLAEEQNHHPDVDWRYNKVIVSLTSHDAGTVVTSRDVSAAEAISAAAADTGAEAKPDQMEKS